jgi:aspartyl-tRNA(Asn)/glutamyl-tRNA(Gln) amidotransferase subunit A
MTTRHPGDALGVLSDCFAVIDARNASLNAIVHLDRAGACEAAEASAERWRQGRAISPIDGMPIVVKANVAVKGMPWTAALTPFAGRVAAEDAAVISDLRAKGAVIVGIANMHEAALGATTTSPLYGQCKNPLDETCTPGGSSGGSAAAVASGMCLAAVGTDTMGSVRIPSAYCGIAGIKPSFDRIPRTGVELLSTSLDHVGFHARRANILRDLLSLPKVGPRTAMFLETSVLPPELTKAFAAARKHLTERGIECRTDALRGFDLSALRRLGLLLCEREFAAAHADGLESFLDGTTPTFAEMVRWGARQPEGKVETARAALAQARSEAVRLLGSSAIAILPTAPHTAFPFVAEAPVDQADLTVFANFAGIPSVTIPAGTNATGLPYGVQVLAPAGRDDLALAAAEMIEDLAFS